MEEKAKRGRPRKEVGESNIPLPYICFHPGTGTSTIVDTRSINAETEGARGFIKKYRKYLPDAVSPLKVKEMGLIASRSIPECYFMDLGDALLALNIIYPKNQQKFTVEDLEKFRNNNEGKGKGRDKVRKHG